MFKLCREDTNADKVELDVGATPSNAGV